MFHRLALFMLLALFMALSVAGTASAGSQASKAQAEAAGWDCSPNFPLSGHFHCSPPGHPSLLAVFLGAADPPTLILDLYDGVTELFAGTELLIRADLFAGQQCPQQGGSWAFLDFFGADYYGCHRFTT
jgi:hypothetical protein